LSSSKEITYVNSFFVKGSFEPKTVSFEGFLEGFFEGFFDGVLEVGDVLGNLDLPRLGAGAGDFEDEALDGDDVSF